MELTRDAKHMLKTVYDEYLRRIKDGVPKQQAKDFHDVHMLQSELFPTWSIPDIKSTSTELKNANLVRYYAGGGFLLKDEGISYAENQFKDGLLKAVDVLSKLKP